MKKLGIAAVSVLAVAVSGVLCSAQAADKTVWKLAFNQPEGHPEMVAVQEFSKKLEKATNGKYAIEVFPNELLGSQKETIEMVQNGSLEFSMVAGSLLENWSPDFAVFNLPYVFKDYKHLQRVVKDKKVVGNLFKSIEPQGITVLCAMYSGTRNVYTKNKEVRTPADLKGLKIRVMQSDTMVKMLNYMGGTGTPMGQAEVYTAIQTGVLDGAENNEVTYYALKQQEVAPIYNLTGHLMMPDYIVTNTKFYNSLPKEVKDFFDKNLDGLVDDEFERFQAQVSKSLEAAKKEGTKVIVADKDAFKKAVEPLIAEKVTTPSAKALYDAVQAARDAN
ncbi:MAG: TRAP transporter substrate-binding protein [Aeromonadales bacterium]|jgi:tripartite ATP-independent transporter DctP family solute receptor|nr:TRAP transporter substrate-binding protein [Aeromonadales bacterium]MDY2891909.1 TRAP transporter substrate-binding protein [Succinivibrio sp.]